MPEHKNRNVNHNFNSNQNKNLNLNVNLNKNKTKDKDQNNNTLLNASKVIDPSEIFVDAEEFSENPNEDLNNSKIKDPLHAQSLNKQNYIKENEDKQLNERNVEEFNKENAKRDIIIEQIEAANSSPNRFKNEGIENSNTNKNKNHNNKKEDQEKELLSFKSSPSTGVNKRDFKKYTEEVFQSNTCSLNIYPINKNDLANSLSNDKQSEENFFLNPNNPEASKFPNSKEPEVKHTCLCC